MRISYSLFLTFFVCFLCNSQKSNHVDSNHNLDTIYDKNIQRITNNLDEFIIIKNYNEQIIQSEIIYDDYKIIDTLSTSKSTSQYYYQEFTKYLFYKKENKIYIKKFDNFGEYSSIEINNNFIFEFLKKKINKIKTEKLKSYCIKTIFAKNKITYDFVMVPIPLFTEIYLKSKNINSITKYNYHDMRNENNENINYVFNQNLNVIKLEKLCKSEIEKIESKKKFEKINNQ